VKKLTPQDEDRIAELYDEVCAICGSPRISETLQQIKDEGLPPEAVQSAVQEASRQAAAMFGTAVGTLADELKAIAGSTDKLKELLRAARVDTYDSVSSQYEPPPGYGSSADGESKSKPDSDT
jgi:hypothetical protein